MRLTKRVLGALLIVVGSVVAGCGRGHREHAVIGVDAPVSLADRPVHLKISGLSPHDTIEVGGAAQDYQGGRWHSQAVFRADGHGVVDLEHARARSGTYTGVDGMGLFWSMVPPSGDADDRSFVPPPPNVRAACDVQITVDAHGHRLAARTLTRQWLTPGVGHQSLTLADDKVDGDLYLPPPTRDRHPAVLLFGGSEGGNDGSFDAALLASHGYPALSLAYFRDPGLPATLQDIPLEYFARAARLLAAQPGADPAHVVARGISRGTEAALLLGQLYPRLIHGVILYSPSNRVNPGLGTRGASGAAWTWHGRPIPQKVIPLDHVDGPVLAIAGADDRLWPEASTWARQIMTDLDHDHDRFPHQALIHPRAGHGVGTFPYGAAGVVVTNPTDGRTLRLGGTRADNAAARAQDWPKVLAFLAAMS
ncbi:acyl-CoA thioesterase/BAAT N-terminal domain-containing protein [Actinoallomurus soli]|uniref:acyl-CoA thioesterase/BAAT N-terminal domain-containing protein n=1 Tax=Actinoallomurus soli TaxID=2952535 RepID=UPI002092658D|nr:acyl-CoA thioesterase/BAAT N-terminal domain-containing protein [Actinoallomurus soli]MCO5970364.1 acyl-CoA thioesterase/BAAT N-terminal domain-containing protein [Actinoallomurus soli]